MAVLGKLRCWNPDCGEEYPVTENDKGTLSQRCLHCGFSPYWPKGTKVHADVRASLAATATSGGPPADPAPAPPAPPAADPPPPTARGRSRSLLNPFAA